MSGSSRRSSESYSIDAVIWAALAVWLTLELANPLWYDAARLKWILMIGVLANVVCAWIARQRPDASRFGVTRAVAVVICVVGGVGFIQNVAWNFSADGPLRSSAQSIFLVGVGLCLLLGGETGRRMAWSRPTQSGAAHAESGTS